MTLNVKLPLRSHFQANQVIQFNYYFSIFAKITFLSDVGLGTA